MYPMSGMESTPTFEGEIKAMESVVEGPNGERLVFEVVTHFSTKPEDQGLEADFFIKLGKTPPVGEHYELQMLAHPPLKEGVPMHIHQNPATGKWFVCYVPRVPTLEEAEVMFKTWSLGTAYALIHGKDFLPILREVKYSDKDFVERMESLGIKTTIFTHRISSKDLDALGETVYTKGST